METSFDPAKNAANIAKHGLSLADFAGFDAEPTVLVDDRFDYGETRSRAFGRIDGDGHCLVFTMRGSTMHLISFRRAHEKEMRRYE
jgi:uncharacterized protein